MRHIKIRGYQMSLTDEGVFGGKPQFTSQEQAFWYRQRDVKASVRKIKEDITIILNGLYPYTLKKIIKIVDEEMGEKLI